MLAHSDVPAEQVEAYRKTDHPLGHAFESVTVSRTPPHGGAGASPVPTLAIRTTSRGLCYASRVSTDTPESAALRVEANAGDADAQLLLGFIYQYGRGVPQDYAQAVAWYRKAADQGFADAQYNLGLMYGNGQGVPEDYVEGYKWLNLAAFRAFSEKKRYAETLDVVAKTMTPAQLAEAQQRASAWLAAFEKRGGK